MADLILSLADLEEQHISQLEYALAFATEDALACRIDLEKRELHVDLAEGADAESVRQKMQQLVERYQKSEFGHRAEQQPQRRADTGKAGLAQL